MNFEVEKAFVEDMEVRKNQVLVGITVANPAGLILGLEKNLSINSIGVVADGEKAGLDETVRVILDINNYRNEQKVR